MLRNTLRFLLVISACFVLSRCSEQTVDMAKPKRNLSLHDRMAVDLAKSVSRSSDLVPVRDFLKDQATLKFDGDYDILLQAVRSKPVSGLKASGRNASLTFEEVLLGSNSENSGRNTSGGGTSFLDSLGALFPLMQIAIPALDSKSAENWNTQTHQPLVAVMPADFQEGVTKTITAFDAAGREYEIDAEKQPENLVMVISHNERLIAVPKGTMPERGRTKSECILLYFSSATHDYYLNDNTSTGCGGGGGGWGGGGGSGGGNLGCARTEGSWERLRGIYFSQSAWAAYEGWPAGAPEIDVRVYAPSSATNFQGISSILFLDNLEPNRRNDIDERWWDPNRSIVAWNTNTYSSTLLYSFVEDDAEPFIQLKTISLSGQFKVAGVPVNLSATFETGTLDEDMGHKTVDFCAQPPALIGGLPCYDLSKIYFRSVQ